jgi:hypothetical protein
MCGRGKFFNQKQWDIFCTRYLDENLSGAIRAVGVCVHSIIAQSGVANWRCFCRRAEANILARSPCLLLFIATLSDCLQLERQAGSKHLARSLSLAGPVLFCFRFSYLVF